MARWLSRSLAIAGVGGTLLAGGEMAALAATSHAGPATDRTDAGAANLLGQLTPAADLTTLSKPADLSKLTDSVMAQLRRQMPLQVPAAAGANSLTAPVAGPQDAAVAPQATPGPAANGGLSGLGGLSSSLPGMSGSGISSNGGSGIGMQNQTGPAGHHHKCGCHGGGGGTPPTTPPPTTPPPTTPPPTTPPPTTPPPTTPPPTHHTTPPPTVHSTPPQPSTPKVVVHTAPPQPVAVAAPVPPTQSLAYTGFNAKPVAAAGIAALVGGAVLTAVARPRRREGADA